MGRLYWGGLLGLLGLFLFLRKRAKKQLPNLPIKNQEPMMEVLPINQFHASPYWANLRHYIAAQTIHETSTKTGGAYSSRLAVEQKNITGMKIPSRRPFVGFKDTKPYMRYTSFFQSIQDLLLWMAFTKFPLSVPDSKSFVAELKKRKYFEDSEANYLRGVNSALRKLPYSPIVKIVD
jgi:hypothetical protein